MKKLPYKTSIKFRNFSPKLGNGGGFPKNLHLNNIYNIGNVSEYYRIAKFGNNNNNSSNIFLYYSPKNININNARIRNVYSSLKKGFLRKSSSQTAINYNRPLTHKPKVDNSLYSYSFAKSPNYGKKKIHFNLEKEKLYQETYQIRKMVNYLNKKLSMIKLENLKKDNQINRRQKKINDIIISNNESNIFENTNKENNIDIQKNTNLNLHYGDMSYLNDFSINSSINNNFDNVPIYSNFNLHTSKKSGTYNLLKKIKKSINNITTEIDSEKQKYEKIKRSLFLTKLNELNIESNLLEEQINKINTFIQRDIQIQEENHKKKDNLLNLQLNIERQEKIIKSLNERSNYLDKEEENLKLKLEEMKKKLESKTKKISINNKKLSLLIQKNNTLSKNKEQSTKNTKEIKINNNKVKNPDEIKTYYTGEISKLNKIINFYSSQCVFSEKEIARLKEQHIKAEVINNKEVIKPIKSNYNYNKNLIKYNTHLSDKEKITKMNKTLKEVDSEKNKLKKKLDIYQNKLLELEKQNDEEDFYNKSQIEFGIDEKNPFCVDNNDNNPEKTEKFTSVQFNQFTYILFKNFESRGISYEESKDKVFKLFEEFNSKNNISNDDNSVEINYKSDKFNLIAEGYSKIILDILNRNNAFNFLYTKIFIKALLYNSECDINKLIEYFKILFSYTRNHSLEEEKNIQILKTKHAKNLEKLISCVKEYISSTGKKNKKYIDLLKMKNLLETNKIEFEDEYIEFIFYYMKKFEDPEAKLGELKLSLLYDLIDNQEYYSFEKSDMNINTQEENNLNNDINIDINKNNEINKNKNTKKNSKKKSKEKSLKKTKDKSKEEKNDEILIDDNNNNSNIKNNSINNINESIKDESKIEQEKSKEKEKYIEEEPKKEKINENLGKDKKIGMFDHELIVPDPKDKKSITEDNLSPKIQNMPIEFDNRREKNNKNIDMDRENTDDMEEDEDSMTEITNEEYVKQLTEAIKQMKEGLEKAKVNFLDLMNNVVQKRKISGRFYEYVTIEDFNEQLKSINITLSDLKLSCLCSKYCIPNELRLVDKNKINKDIQKFIKGTLKLEEDEENL